MKSRLTWWLAACLSFTPILVSIHNGFAARVLERDVTYISLGIVVLYCLITAWLGWALHFGDTAQHIEARLWAYWYAENAQPLGLIGTVIALVLLFGLSGDTAALDEQAIFNGIGTAIFTTLVGAVYGVFMGVQLTILGEQ
jgi:hypothetical protein